MHPRRWASVAAILATVGAGCAPAPPAQSAAPAAVGGTPRLANGQPDLNGMWGGGGGEAEKPDAAGNLTVLTKGRPCSPFQNPCAPGVNFERDAGMRLRMNPNVPQYKPEHWERVQYLDQHGNVEDPEWKCRPMGLPRGGPPNKIVHTDKEVVFLYRAHNTFRVIPTDGREHDEIRAVDTTWQGDSVGRWEGETLVVDTVGFTDESWLGWPGWFHSNNMHVVERVTRKGDELLYEVTVEDPDVLLEPWVMDPVRLPLNKDPKAMLLEDLPCEERDFEHMTSRERG